MVDCNNQYGWAMSQYLPTGGFNWCDEKSNEEWEEIIRSLKDDDDKGFFFEVDLEYPKELHDEHDTFPCAPEHICHCSECSICLDDLLGFTVPFEEISGASAAYF